MEEGAGDGGDKVSDFEVIALTYLRLIFATLLMLLGDNSKGRWKLWYYCGAAFFLVLAILEVR